IERRDLHIEVVEGVRDLQQEIREVRDAGEIDVEVDQVTEAGDGRQRNVQHLQDLVHESLDGFHSEIDEAAEELEDIVELHHVRVGYRNHDLDTHQRVLQCLQRPNHRTEDVHHRIDRIGDGLERIERIFDLLQRRIEGVDGFVRSVERGVQRCNRRLDRAGKLIEGALQVVLDRSVGQTLDAAENRGELVQEGLRGRLDLPGRLDAL